MVFLSAGARGCVLCDYPLDFFTTDPFTMLKLRITETSLLDLSHGNPKTARAAVFWGSAWMGRACPGVTGRGGSPLTVLVQVT